jgi:acyl-CoA synthetase (AMP-forming)/AMP-acid ligase II
VAAFFGCLYAGVVAVPAFPPRPNRGRSRLEGILQDCDAALVLSPSRVASGLSDGLTTHGRWESLPCLATDDVALDRADEWDGPSAAGEDIAYLQYTSGSTSEPRGVIVTHANVLYNCAYMRKVFALSSETVAVTWAPHFHDMGLIEGLANPLCGGYPTLLMPPAHFVGRPIRWLQAITRRRATHTGGPNFAYDLCVRAVRPEQRAELDLSSLETAYSGSEPVRRATLERFSEYFAPCGFRREAFHPAYGLAETTLMVTGGRSPRGPVYRNFGTPSTPRVLVGCGRAHDRTVVAIVDPGTRRRCPEGDEGEIWVGGPTVAGGYWRRPDATRETFQATTADTAEGPFLRTGDLGRLDQGELFITGRLKDLIILNGANLYPQDIEWVAGEAHDALRPGACAAFSVDVDDEERLVVAQEVERRHRAASTAELDEIAGAVRQEVARAFDVEVYTVQLLKVGALPRTSSGKVRRHACRADFLAGRAETLWESRLDRAAAHPRPARLGRERLVALKPRQRGLALEEHLRRKVARGLRVHWRDIDPRRGLGSYGLESLKGRELIAELEESLELKLSTSTLFNYPSISELSVHLLSLLRIEPSEAATPETTDQPRGTS